MREGGTHATPTVAQLADDLERLVTDTLGELWQGHLREGAIPRFFAGHPVEPDVAADVAFTLGHLLDLGVELIGPTPTEEAIRTVLSGIDGSRTHTFFSYRVAETLARFGTLDSNRLLAGMGDESRQNLLDAVDSTDWVQLLDSGLPRNYGAVLARCELARRDLGVEVDGNLLDSLVERTREMLGADPTHLLDDSTHGVGRVDIYTVDVWLFTEPLAPLLGGLWDRGTAAAISLVEATGTPRGAAVSWGRSTGALACALTVEMAALVLSGNAGTGGWTTQPAWWHRRLAEATEEMHGWFDAGLTTAHRNRNTYAYRGPFRRLQMTVDLLGKLAWSAGRLRSCADPDPSLDVPSPDISDGLVRLSERTGAAVWTDRDAARPDRPCTVVPLVGATRSDYVAAPRRPGLYEVPVDSDIACWVPTVLARQHRFAPCGTPDRVEATREGLSATWHRLRRLGELDPAPDADHLEGSATLRWQRGGRSIEVESSLHLGAAGGGRVPEAVAVNVPETAGRPLRVELLASEPAASLDTVDTAGIDEWRSFWAELPLLHQIEVRSPESRCEMRYRVTPTVRVASSAHSHHYDESLYGPLAADRRAVSRPNPLGPLRVGSRPEAEALRDVDLYHLHWPEWLAFDDVEEHRRIAWELSAAATPVLWTAHNLTPHEKRPEVFEAIYSLWAEQADAVIHHSAWGRDRMLDRYGFSPECTHHVIPHGHFGALYPSATTSRRRAEELLGLDPCELRVGVVGAPRVERDVQGFLEALAASANRDIRVCCWSLDESEVAPRDPRIEVAERYRMVDAHTYGLRLAACDVLALPFDPQGEMLATGVAADVVGCAKAALASPWGYLTEVLGDAAIDMGSDRESMTAALDALEPQRVDRARRASAELAGNQSWEVAADLTMEVIESLLEQ